MRQYKLNNGDWLTLSATSLNVGERVTIPVMVRPNWFMRLLGKKERAVYREFVITDKLPPYHCEPPMKPKGA